MILARYGVSTIAVELFKVSDKVIWLAIKGSLSSTKNGTSGPLANLNTNWVTLCLSFWGSINPLI